MAGVHFVHVVRILLLVKYTSAAQLSFPARSILKLCGLRDTLVTFLAVWLWFSIDQLVG